MKIMINITTEKFKAAQVKKVNTFTKRKKSTSLHFLFK